MEDVSGLWQPQKNKSSKQKEEEEEEEEERTTTAKSQAKKSFVSFILLLEFIDNLLKNSINQRQFTAVI